MNHGVPLKELVNKKNPTALRLCDLDVAVRGLAVDISNVFSYPCIYDQLTKGIH